MNHSFSKNLLRKILKQIKIGISKRVSFIKVFITPTTSIKNLLYICYTLKKIGLISHIQKNSLENNYFVLWLNFTFIGTNAYLISYNKFGRITSIPYHNFKQIKKTNLTNLDSMIISTNKGILTEQQLLKVQVGGIYLYSSRYINVMPSFESNLQINIQSIIQEHLFKHLHKSIWITSIYTTTYIETNSIFRQFPKTPIDMLNSFSFRQLINWNTTDFYLIHFLLWVAILNSQLNKIRIKTMRLRGIGYKFEKIHLQWININIDTNHLLIGNVNNLVAIRFSRKFRLIKIKTLNYCSLMQFQETIGQLKLPHKFAAKHEGFHLILKRALKFRIKRRRYRYLLSSKKRKRKRRSTQAKQIKKLKFLNLNINLSYYNY